MWPTAVQQQFLDIFKVNKIIQVKVSKKSTVICLGNTGRQTVHKLRTDTCGTMNKYYVL